MKRTIALWLGLAAAAVLLAFALSPALAQTPTEATASTGKVHGLVTGAHNHSLASSGTVTLSAEGGNKADYKFKISKNGTYTGELPAGSYSARVMMQDQSGFAEYTKSSVEVTIAAGQDVLRDIDLGDLEAAAAAPIKGPATGAPIKGPTGSIHGRVIGPDGTATPAGTVSLSLDGGATAKFSYQVNALVVFTGY